MTLHTLHLEQSAADVLACALLQSIDDLEARAILSEHQSAVLGPISAAEYRADIQRLRAVLETLAHDRVPSPDRAAVLWIDGTWTVHNDQPVRLHRRDDLEAILESSLDLVHHGLIDAHDALLAIQHLVATDRLHLSTPTDLVHPDRRHVTTDHETTPTVQTTTELQDSCFPTLQAAHRVAPGCRPVPRRAGETGGAPC